LKKTTKHTQVVHLRTQKVPAVMSSLLFTFLLLVLTTSTSAYDEDEADYRPISIAVGSNSAVSLRAAGNGALCTFSWDAQRLEDITAAAPVAGVVPPQQAADASADAALVATLSGKCAESEAAISLKYKICFGVSAGGGITQYGDGWIFNLGSFTNTPAAPVNHVSFENGDKCGEKSRRATVILACLLLSLL
jgi:hypothetical protein